MLWQSIEHNASMEGLRTAAVELVRGDCTGQR